MNSSDVFSHNNVFHNSHSKPGVIVKKKDYVEAQQRQVDLSSIVCHLFNETINSGL